MFQKMKPKNKAVFTLLSIVVFIFLVSTISAYYDIKAREGQLCGCKPSLSIIITLLSSAGIAVGIVLSNVITQGEEIKKQEIDVFPFLDFLESDERMIILKLIENKGRISQARLNKLDGFSRVKVHRIIEKLKAKGIIFKERTGKVNKIILNSKYNLLLKKD